MTSFRSITASAATPASNWGVVTVAPRRGISVVMDQEAIQRIQIAPEAISGHVRRYLDSLDLLALPVFGPES